MIQPPNGDVELSEENIKFIETEWQNFLFHIKDLGFKFHLDSFDAQHKSASPHTVSNKIIFHIDGTIDCKIKKKNEKL